MLGNGKQGIFLDVRPDGIYFIIKNKGLLERTIRTNPAKLFEGTGISGADPAIIAAAINSPEDQIEVKLTSDTRHNIKDETISTDISKDLMEAKVAFNSGHPYFGNTLDVIDISNAIKEAGINHGVLTEVIKEISENRPLAGKYVTVALGRQPVAGENGYLKTYFDVGSKGNKPKLLDDGSVDYKDVNYVLKTTKNSLLVETIDASPGIDGINVKGDRVPHRPGKPAPRLPRGRNTYISDDGTKLIAEISGQIQIDGVRVDVNPVLTVPGDVGNETGNLDFTGTILIEGTVQPGFIVKASEGVEVKGAVDGATIESGGDIRLLGGIKGMGKSVIRAGGDIFSRYVERATLIADGDVVSDSIMHSDIKCKGNLVLEGKKGLLVGGHIYVGKTLVAKTIGSSMATATEITVGNSPEFIDKYRDLEQMYKKSKTEYDKEKLIEAYKAGNEDLRLRSLQARIHLRVEMDRLQKEMNELLLVLNSTEGIIKASQTIHPGCKIIVGGVMMKVSDDINACTLRNVDGRVNIGVYINYGD